MARETKIGMLVGLGFIVCFAVILENRGRQDRIGPQMPHEILAQSTPQTQSVTPSTAERRARDYARPEVPDATMATERPVRRPGRRHGAEPRTAQPASDGTGPMRTPARAAQTPPDGEADSASGMVPRPRQRRATPTVPPAVSADGQSRPRSGRPPRRQPQPTPPQQVVRVRPAEPPLSLAATASQTQPESESGPQPKPPTGQQYEVKEGDTLTKIAARHYGSQSKSVIEAIYDANRSVLASPHVLQVNQVIVLPETAGGKSLTAAAADKPPAEAKPAANEPPAEKPQPNYRPYQIKKGDRYATIAREQLGSAARWKEIAELNKDIFPDPARIQYGVRIRLPVDTKDQAKGTDS